MIKGEKNLKSSICWYQKNSTCQYLHLTSCFYTERRRRTGEQQPLGSLSYRCSTNLYLQRRRRARGHGRSGPWWAGWLVALQERLKTSPSSITCPAGYPRRDTEAFISSFLLLSQGFYLHDSFLFLTQSSLLFSVLILSLRYDWQERW